MYTSDTFILHQPKSWQLHSCGKWCLESGVDYRSMNHGTRQCPGTNTRESRQAPSRAFLRVVTITQTGDVLIDRAGPRNAAWCLVRTLLMYAECNDGPNTYRREFLHFDIDTSGKLLLIMAILRESCSSGFLLYANIYRRAEVSFHVMSKLRNSSTAARAVTQRSYEIASHLYPGAKY